MINIYQKARAVRVWLGAEHTKGDGSAALESVRNLSDSMCRAINTKLSALDLHENIYNKFLFPNFRYLPKVSSFSPEFIASLKPLFSSTWFTRLWVIQEVNSSAQCWIHFGNDTVEWIRVYLVACYILMALRSQFSETFYSQAWTIGAHFKKSRSVSSYLIQARRFRCTDARDMVYGLLGLIRAKYPEVPMEANYEIPVLEVYTKIMVIFLSNAQEFMPSRSSLDALKWAMFDSNSDWPSWVARWDREVPAVLRGIGLSSCGVSRTRFVPLIDWENKVLELRGLVLDTIINTAGPINEQLCHPPIHGENREAVQVFWRTILNQTNTAREGQDPFVACAMALTCGTDGNGRLAKERVHSRKFKVFLQEVFDESRLQNNGKFTEVADDFLHSVFQNCTTTERSYFTTDTGFKGCTRLQPEPGDLVCILFEAGFPLILRAHSDGYVLIDHAYVYGVMNGEFMNEWKAGKLPHIKEQTFRLH
jgi:hypothetical protein